MTLPVVILAGGYATRLRPLTEKIPKALVLVSGKPFIEWQISLLKSQGYKELIILTGFLGNQIKEYLGNGEKYGITINYCSDGSTLLGTGGAIKNAIDLLPENFFIMYGDTYLPINFIEVEEAYFNKNKKALMTIFKNNNAFDKSNIIYENDKIIKYVINENLENLEYIDYGLSIFSKEVFLKINTSKFELKTVFIDLISLEELGAYRVYKRFYEMGRVETLIETENYFRGLK